MTRITSTVFSSMFGIAATVVLASGLGQFAASAQEPARIPREAPGKLTVTSRVYDKKQLLGGPVLSETAQRGRAMWQQRCGYCHDGAGQPSYKTMGPWLGAETVQIQGEDSVRAFIAAGSSRMPAFRYTLKPQQVDDLIAFLRTITSDKKPTAAQLAGTQAEVNTGE